MIFPTPMRKSLVPSDRCNICVVVDSADKSFALFNALTEVLKHNGFQVSSIQLGDAVPMQCHLVVASNCSLEKLAAIDEYSGKLISIELRRGIIRLFNDLGPNHTFSVDLTGDTPPGCQVNAYAITIPRLVTVYCARPHGFREGQKIDLSANGPIAIFSDGVNVEVTKVVDDLTFTFQMDSLDESADCSKATVNGFAKPSTTTMTRHFVSLINQLKNPKFDSSEESNRVLFDLLDKPDESNIVDKTNLLAAYTAASLACIEAVKATSKIFEPISQWLLVNVEDFWKLSANQLPSTSVISRNSNAIEDASEDAPLSTFCHRFIPIDLASAIDSKLASSTAFITCLTDADLGRLYDKIPSFPKPIFAFRYALGTLGNISVTLPSKTELPRLLAPLGQLPMPPHCVLKHFPNQVSHCILWALTKFESLLQSKPESVNQFVQKVLRNDLSALEGSTATTAMHYLVYNVPKTYQECIAMGRAKFEKYFSFKAKQLTYSFPSHHRESDGRRFWAIPRRLPQPISFNAANPVHLAFILAAAEAFATLYDIAWPSASEFSSSLFKLEDFLRNVVVPEFVPKQKRIQTTDKPEEPEESDKVEVVEEIARDRSPSAARMSFIEKAGEDSSQVVERAIRLVKNLQVKSLQKSPGPSQNATGDYAYRFVLASAMLRASMYGFEEPSLSWSNLVNHFLILSNPEASSNVVAFPAIGTLVTSLGLAELFKLALDAPIDTYRNTTIGIAKSLIIQRSTPPPAQLTVVSESLSFTPWDRWIFDGSNESFTIAQLIDQIKSRYSVKVTSVLQGSRPVYLPFLPGHPERKNAPISKFLEADVGNPGVYKLSALLEPPPDRPNMPASDDFNADEEDIESPPIYLNLV